MIKFGNPIGFVPAASGGELRIKFRSSTGYAPRRRPKGRKPSLPFGNPIGFVPAASGGELRFKQTLLSVFILVGLAWPVRANPDAFEQGMDALSQGNFAEAYCRWKSLSELGHAESQYNLGWLYANGNGMNVDLAQAMHWWQKAADQGHADAQFAIGLTHTNGGDGMQKDLVQAAKRFTRAALQGHRDAREILTRLSADPGFDLIAASPELVHQTWFGKQAYIKSDRVNVRKAASKTSAIVRKLKRNSSVRIVGRVADWLQIVLPGTRETAWVYRTLVVNR